MARFLTALWDALQNQRERWIFWLPVPMAYGIAAYFGLHAEPPLLLGTLVLVLMLPLLHLFYRNQAAFIPVLAVFMAVAGFTAGQWRTHNVAAPVLERQTYSVTLQGKITGVEPQAKNYRIVLEDFHVVAGNIWQDDLPKRVRIKLKNKDPAVPQAGDVVKIRAALLPLSAPVMPGAFDFQRHAFFQGLGGTGYAIGNLEVVQERSGGEFFFEKLRRQIRERIFAAIADRDNAAMMTAFMIGEDLGISERDWDIARQSGIAHLIAISGSHFILIAGFPFFFVRAFLAAIPYVALRWPIKKIAAAVAMAVSVFYMLLIGSPIPAQRAVIMTCVVMTAIMLDRNPFTLRLAVFAALLLFIVSPESLMGPSFQMSFAAVVGLIAFYESTADWWKKHFHDAPWSKRYALYLLGCFSTSLVASLATSPFALYHFGRMPLLGGLAANMIAVPVSSFITFPVGLMSCLLMPLGLEKGPLILAEKSLDVFMYVAEIIAQWEYAGWQTNGFPGWVVGIMAIGGIWVCAWQGWVRWLGLAPITLAVLIACFTPRADVLVNDDGVLIAVRAPDGGMWFSTMQRDKFVRQQWTAREGQGADLYPWPDGYGSDSDVIACDSKACRARIKGHVISFIRRPEAVLDECADSSVMISDKVLKRLPECKRRVPMLDKWKLRDNGAHAVYMTDAETPPRIVSVRDNRGTRPWTGRVRKPREKKD